MTGSSSSYEPKRIESKWQAFWQREGTHDVNLKAARDPYYVLMMFPYPSAEGLHARLESRGELDVAGLLPVDTMDLFAAL